MPVGFALMTDLNGPATLGQCHHDFMKDLWPVLTGMAKLHENKNYLQEIFTTKLYPNFCHFLKFWI